MCEKFLHVPFNQININDPFFDSLKENYAEFTQWFANKSEAGESAFIQLVNNNLEGFLYLKIEQGPINDVNPAINVPYAIKIGTFKVNPHGTRLGERFIKKSLDFAISNSIPLVYVTIFPQHDYLINMFLKFGFSITAQKETANGIENVLTKDLSQITGNLLHDYPRVNSQANSFLLAIKPEYHTKLFPDSKLLNETFDIIRDVSHTNSITKIYIAKMRGIADIRPNDNILIYRTTDYQGPARYRSVATSVCTVEDIQDSSHFPDLNSLKNFCKNYSIFSDCELQEEFINSGQRFYVIKMTYNFSLSRRITNGTLKDSVGLNPTYWGVFPLTHNQFNQILQLGQVNPYYLY